MGIIHIIGECRCGAIREIALAEPCPECGAEALEIMFRGPAEEVAQLTLEEIAAEDPIAATLQEETARQQAAPNPNRPGKSGVARDPHLYCATDPAGRIAVRRRRSRFTISARMQYELGGEMAIAEVCEQNDVGWVSLDLPLGLARFLAGALPWVLADYDEQEALRREAGSRKQGEAKP